MNVTMCPECRSRAYLHSALMDGRARLWLHCFGCGWDSERTDVWGVDELKARYSAGKDGRWTTR